MSDTDTSPNCCSDSSCECDSDFSVSLTENFSNDGLTTGVKGSVVVTDKGVEDPRVVLNTKLVRDAKTTDIETLMYPNLHNKEYIRDFATMAFQCRDIRGGKGERKLFYTMLQVLEEGLNKLGCDLLPLVPEYGSWKDVFVLANHKLFQKSAFELIVKQLEDDEVAFKENPKATISLLAKWAPREGKSNSMLAIQLARILYEKNHNCTIKNVVEQNSALREYRKRIANLNRHLKTVEVLECGNQWDEIEPGHVPAKAREIKKRAYLNEKVKGKKGELRNPEDEKRMKCRENFQGFFAKAARGEVKISGSETLHPHDIVKKAHSFIVSRNATEEDKNSLNAVWNEMVQKYAEKLGDSIVMCDFSGSMQSASKVGDLPYYVSMAMGILASSMSESCWRNSFLGFDSIPQWIQFPDNAKTLFERISFLHKNQNFGQGLSTNFEAAAKLIVKTLKKNNVTGNMGPKNIIVVTDMGFDAACGYHGQQKGDTHVQLFQKQFEDAGIKTPRIVIWNVAAQYSNNHQAKANEHGVLTVSGWSPSVFTMICDNSIRAITPYEGLRALLDVPRYDKVREVVNKWFSKIHFHFYSTPEEYHESIRNHVPDDLEQSFTMIGREEWTDCEE